MLRHSTFESIIVSFIHNPSTWFIYTDQFWVYVSVIITNKWDIKFHLMNVRHCVLKYEGYY